jgi:hypothetical protein
LKNTNKTIEHMKRFNNSVISLYTYFYKKNFYIIIHNEKSCVMYSSSKGMYYINMLSTEYRYLKIVQNFDHDQLTLSSLSRSSGSFVYWRLIHRYWFDKKQYKRIFRHSFFFVELTPSVSREQIILWTSNQHQLLL